MKIRVNGTAIDFDGATVRELLDRYRVTGGAVAVERNGAIVHREDYARQGLAEGDIIEIVRFVGGG